MRVGIVCEGRTDFPLLQAVVLSVLGPCEVSLLQPLRDGLGWRPPHGWTAVRSWCRERSAEGLADEIEIGQLDVLIIQVDGDLCGREDLPATRPDLCAYIRTSWIGSADLPRGVILCIPARSTDTWLAVALDPSLLDGSVEEDPGVVAHLDAVGVRKCESAYKERAGLLGTALPRIRSALPELDRFARKLEGASRHG